jgi:CHAD domain-containing protein
MSTPAFPAPVKAAPPPWPGHGAERLRERALLRLLVAACAAQIVPNAAAVAAGSHDQEHVHQLRIGLRRLRSAARAMRDAAAGLPHGWEPAMQELFEAAGAVRDRYVLASTTASALRRAGAPLVTPEEPADGDAAGRVLAACAASERFQGTLRRLQHWVDADVHDRADAGEQGALEHLRARLDRLLRRVLRDAGHFEAMAFEQRHRTRKRLKRLRYVADMLAPLFERRSVRRWQRAAQRAQDALGRCIDHELALQRFEATALTDARAWFAVGWLRAHAGRAARRARRRLRRLRRVDAFW